MKYFAFICFIFLSCASTTPYYVSIYAESKPELNTIIKDLEEKNIKYKVIAYPSQRIYEIMYEDPNKSQE